jgi:hypothetical protein
LKIAAAALILFALMMPASAFAASADAGQCREDAMGCNSVNDRQSETCRSDCGGDAACTTRCGAEETARDKECRRTFQNCMNPDGALVEYQYPGCERSFDRLLGCAR